MLFILCRGQWDTSVGTFLYPGLKTRQRLSINFDPPQKSSLHIFSDLQSLPNLTRNPTLSLGALCFLHLLLVRLCSVEWFQDSFLIMYKWLRIKDALPPKGICIYFCVCALRMAAGQGVSYFVLHNNGSAHWLASSLTLSRIYKFSFGCGDHQWTLTN